MEKSGNRPLNIGKILLNNNIYFLVLFLFLIPLFTIPEFGSLGSITVLVKNISLWGIMAIGMTFVLLLGVTDLSIGMNVSMITVVLIYACQTLGFILGALTAILTGLAGGLLNGLTITKMKINPFITTLGTMVLFKGVGLVICNGSPVSNTNETLAKLFELKILTLPFITITLPMVMMLVCLILAMLVLKYTRFGQDIYVTGGNMEAAKVVGINTDLIFIACYMIVGLSAGITAILLASFQSSGNAAFGETYTLQTIAACVLGGTRLTGGYGNAVKSILGVSALQLITKILYYVASNLANFQIGIIGAILIIVLLLDKLSAEIGDKA